MNSDNEDSDLERSSAGKSTFHTAPLENGSVVGKSKKPKLEHHQQSSSCIDSPAACAINNNNNEERTTTSSSIQAQYKRVSMIFEEIEPGSNNSPLGGEAKSAFEINEATTTHNDETNGKPSTARVSCGGRQSGDDNQLLCGPAPIFENDRKMSAMEAAHMFAKGELNNSNELLESENLRENVKCADFAMGASQNNNKNNSDNRINISPKPASVSRAGSPEEDFRSNDPGALLREISLVSTSDSSDDPPAALSFAEQIIEVHQRLQQSSVDDIMSFFQAVVPMSKLVGIAEKFLSRREALRMTAGFETKVDIGYHFTRKVNLPTIARYGLLTRAESKTAGLLVKYNNAGTYTDGIYTANNAFAYSERGNVGFLVARLRGRTSGEPVRYRRKECDTLVTLEGYHEMVLLEDSSQCIPLVQFPSHLLNWDDDDGIGNNTIHNYHCALQQMVDQLFNYGSVSIVPRFRPSLAPNRRQQYFSRPFDKATELHAIIPEPKPLLYRKYNSPDDLGPVDSELFTEIETQLSSQSSDEEKCPVCWDPLDIGELDPESEVVSLAVCGHLFHKDCIKSALKTDQRCTACRRRVCRPQGKMPNALLVVTKKPMPMPTYTPSGVLELSYIVPAGFQKQYHPSPGIPFRETTKMAYLPNTQEGEDLLKRLVYAFMCGLTFTIGASTSTDQDDTVSWGSIRHETSGCPESAFLRGIHEELDDLGVPSAADC